MAKTVALSKTYDESSISVNTNLDLVRLRPKGMVRSIGLPGQIHAIREIVDNALDETELRPDGQLEVWVFVPTGSNRYQVAVRDNGRGVPLGMLSTLFSVIGASGKHTTENYKTSSGSFGAGSKAANGLSKYFRVVTTRDNLFGSVLFKEAKLEQENTPLENPFNHPVPSGTLVLMEPDGTVFTEMDKFVDGGYRQMIDMFRILRLITRNTTFIMRSVNMHLDETVWHMPVGQLWNYIETTYGSMSVLEYSPMSDHDPYSILYQRWNTDTFSMEFGFERPMLTTDTLGYQLKFFVPKNIKSNVSRTPLLLVNNVVLKDMESDPVVVINDLLKEHILPQLTEKEHQLFFLNVYKLPLCILASIIYEGATFSGFTKEGFTDPVFEKYFRKCLKQQFAEMSTDVWNMLFGYLIPDIISKYEATNNKVVTKKEMTNLSLEIAKFTNCSTPNRMEAELFLLEGDSAAHVEKERDTRIHAIFAMKGKPPCEMTRMGNEHADYARLIAGSRLNKVYDELRKIINIQPNQTDLSTCNFGKIILFNDADYDGLHIRSLNLVALYLMNWRLLSEGMVYLAHPPLYEMTHVASGKKLYLKDEKALWDKRIECLYSPLLDITIRHAEDLTKEFKMSDAAYREFCYLVMHIGDVMTRLANRLAIPIELMEKLVYMSSNISKEQMNLTKLRETFGPHVFYNMDLNVLTISFGMKDFTFSLDGVQEAIYENILPILNRISWKKFVIHLKTKESKEIDNLVSYMQLYHIFESLNGLFTIDRHKGLGGMSAESLYRTCMDPNTRILQQVTSLGDITTIYDMMGDQASTRKKYLQEKGLLPWE